MNVRRAVLGDLPKLIEFISEEAMEAEGRTTPPKSLGNGIRAALEDDSKAMYWVLLDDAGEAIGCISALKEWSDWNAGFYWWIQSIYILPAYRGMGHMVSLLDAVVEEMENQDGLELRLYVHEHNEQAIRAYTKASFRKLPYQIMVLRK